MKEAEKSSRKHISQFKKHSVSEKTRSDYPSSYSSKDSKEEQYSPFLGRGMKSLGRKYVQQNFFKVKEKEKEHHEIVISDEVVRNSKQYRMLRDKIEMREVICGKERRELNETKEKLSKEIGQIKMANHNTKLTLWQLKNQILELKGLLNDEEEEARRLDRELQNPQEDPYGEQQEEEQQEMAQEGSQQGPRLNSQENSLSDGGKQEELLELAEYSKNFSQQQLDIRFMMSHIHRKIHMNPQQERVQSKFQPEQEKQ